MLQEFKDVRQIAGERRRRRYWSDKTFELFVWVEPDGKPWGFELRYKLAPEEPLSGVRWTPVERFICGRIHSGSQDGLSYNVGLHLSGVCASFPPSALARFDAANSAVDAPLRRFVRAKLSDFARRFSPD